MKNYCKHITSSMICSITVLLLLIAGTINAQLVTNGGFESSNTGVIDSTGIEGWIFPVADGINPAPYSK